MENAGFLFAAYSIVWAISFAYLAVLFNRQRRLRRDIESLREALRGKQAEK